METLRKVTEEVFFINGVERSSVTSLFTPNVRYNEVVEDGFRGGNIVGADFAGTPGAARARCARTCSSRTGSAASSPTTRPRRWWSRRCMENDPQTGRAARPAGRREAARGHPRQVREREHGRAHHRLRQGDGRHRQGRGRRARCSSASPSSSPRCCCTGTRARWCSRSLALICAIVPVIWLLGLLPVFGLGLDPMSILVPFLIFSIAVSHAVQMTNAWKLETLHGADGITASHALVPEALHPGRDGAARQRARLHGDRVRRHRDRARARASPRPSASR